MSVEQDRQKLRVQARKLAEAAELHRRAGDDYFVIYRRDLAESYYQQARNMDQAVNLLCKLIARLR